MTSQRPHQATTGLTGSTQGFNLSLHGAFSSYAIYYEKKQIPWFERSWGPLLYSFDSFLAFGWSTMVVVDRETGKAHIVIQQKSVKGFADMVKAKFHEDLPALDNPRPIVPSSHRTTFIRNISTLAGYNKLHVTLRAVELEALKERVATGDVRSVKRLWNSRKHTFLALDLEWWEKNPTLILEAGTASMRCAHIDAAGIWPPVPDINYRKSHLVVTPHQAKSLNVKRPNHSAGYAFGSSYLSDSVGLVQYLSSIFASIASSDSTEEPNTLVLVGHDISGTLQRLHELGRAVMFPSNTLVVDLTLLERSAFRSSRRTIGSPAFTGRDADDRLSLLQTLGLLRVPLMCELGNAGNSAFYTLVALQCLLEPETCRPKAYHPQPQTFGLPRPISRTTSATSLALAQPGRPYSPPTLPYTRRNNSTSSIPARSSPLATQAPVVAPSRPIWNVPPPSAFAHSSAMTASSSSTDRRKSSSAPPKTPHIRSNSLPPSAATIAPSTPPARAPPNRRTSSTPKPPSSFSPQTLASDTEPTTPTPKARRRTSFLGRILSSSSKKKEDSLAKASKLISATQHPVPYPSSNPPVADPVAVNRPTGAKPAVLATPEKNGGKRSSKVAAKAASDKMDAMQTFALRWDGVQPEESRKMKDRGREEQAWEFV